MAAYYLDVKQEGNRFALVLTPGDLRLSDFDSYYQAYGISMNCGCVDADSPDSALEQWARKGRWNPATPLV